MCALVCKVHICVCVCVRALIGMGSLWKNDSVFQSGACLPSVQTSERLRFRGARMDEETLGLSLCGEPIDYS